MSDLFTIWQTPSTQAFIYNPADGVDLVTQKVNAICFSWVSVFNQQPFTCSIDPDTSVLSISDGWDGIVGTANPGDCVYSGSTVSPVVNSGSGIPSGWAAVFPYTPSE